ncbi:MAG TPA: hypothetical protein DCM05_11215 [Elusimicrobia bacterium]|nr:hypothetical protein [Elusimicrobiota bacterium]
MSGTDPLKASLAFFCLALPLTIAGANLGWGLALAAMLFLARGRPGWEALRSPLEAPLWIYLGVCLASALLGVDAAHSLRAFHKEAHKLWLYYLLAFAFAWALSAEGRALRTLLLSLSAGFAAAALLGCGQWLASALGPGALGRAHAFVHPVTYGEQMAVGFLGAFAFLLSPSEETSSGRGRRAVWALAALLGAALLLSNTRGAALGAAAGAAAVLFFTKGWRRWSVLAAAVFAAVVAVMEGLAMLSGRSLVGELTGSAPSQNQLMRLTLWSVAWSMAADHPWTGVGLANYRTAFNTYYGGPLDGRETTWGDAHNLFFHQLAERGLLGLGALLLLLGVLWWRAFQRAREDAGALNLWALGTATALPVMSLTESALQVELVWMLVWTIWLLAEAQHRRRRTA